MSFYFHWYSHDIQASFCTEICHSFYPNISKICPIYFTDFPIWFCGWGCRWQVACPSPTKDSDVAVHPPWTSNWTFMFLYTYNSWYGSFIIFFPYVISWNMCHGQSLKNTHSHNGNSESQGFTKLWRCSSLAPSHGCGCGSFNTSTGLNSLGLAIFTFGACRNLHQKCQKWCCSLKWVWQHLWIDWSLSRLTAADSTFWRSNPCRFQEFSCMEPWNGLFLVLERSFCCCLFVVVIICYNILYIFIWNPFLIGIPPIAAGSTHSTGQNYKIAHGHRPHIGSY